MWEFFSGHKVNDTKSENNVIEICTKLNLQLTIEFSVLIHLLGG